MYHIKSSNFQVFQVLQVIVFVIIGISDFIAALDLGEVLERMTAGTVVNIQPPQFTAHSCKSSDKELVIS